MGMAWELPLGRLFPLSRPQSGKGGICPPQQCSQLQLPVFQLFHRIGKPPTLSATYACFCQFTIVLQDIILKENFIMHLNGIEYHLSHIEANHPNKQKEKVKM